MASWTSETMITDNSNVRFAITITENSINLTNNTSNVTVSIRVWRTTAGTTYGSGTIYCGINGTAYSSSITSSQVITTDGIVLFRKTLDITHDTNGTKTLVTSGRIAHSEFSASSQTFSHALSVIGNKSTLSVSNGTLGVQQNFDINRSSSTFTHTIERTVSGMSTEVVLNKSSLARYTFTPPLSWSTQNTTGTKVSVVYKLTTFSGSTNIGSNTYTVTYTIPESVKPTCNITLSDGMSMASIYGDYVQGKSKVFGVYNVDLAYNSPIVKNGYKTTIMGVEYGGDRVMSDYLTQAGRISVVAKCTDARGRSDTKTITIDVLEYNSPNIISVTVHRCNADGTENLQGSYCKVTYSHTISPLNEINDKIVKLQYRKTTQTQWTTVTLTSEYTADGSTYVFPADDASTYDVQLVIQDDFGSTTRRVSLSTAYTIFHFPASGRGLAIGKVAERDGLDIGMDAHFRNGLTMDIPVVASGDCDQIKTSGEYYIGTLGSHKPDEGLNGWLTVQSFGNDDEYVHQTFVTYSGIKYVRNTLTDGSGAFSDWIRVTPKKADNYFITDGLKVCWGTGSMPFSKYNGSVTEQFPITFTSPPMVSVTQPFNTNNIVVLSDNITTSQFVASIGAVNSETTVQYRAFRWIAIGV